MNPASTARPRPAALALSLPAGAALLLSACAVGKVEHVAMAPPVRSATPSALLVDVDIAPEVRADPAARKAAGVLHARLLEHYGKAGITALPLSRATGAAGAARLRVLVSHADAGSRLQRLAVGFGMGRSALRTQVALEAPGTRGPALFFSSRANSGRRPGMVLPGGIAAATGEASSLAISGGIALFSASRSELARDADRSAKLIVKETRSYYRSVGWHWPTA